MGRRRATDRRTNTSSRSRQTPNPPLDTMMMTTRTRTVARGTFGSKKSASTRGAGRKAAPKGTKKVTRTNKGENNMDLGRFFAPDQFYANAQSGSKAKSKEKAVGYKFTGDKGSAPSVDAQGVKARQGGVVYRFANKYGGNIDEYAPIWTPETRAVGGDTYEPGALGLAVWLAGFASLLAVGAFSIYSTSALVG